MLKASAHAAEIEALSKRVENETEMRLMEWRAAIVKDL
jgi:hypothetical protein